MALIVCIVRVAGKRTCSWLKEACLYGASGPRELGCGSDGRRTRPTLRGDLHEGRTSYPAADLSVQTIGPSLIYSKATLGEESRDYGARADAWRTLRLAAIGSRWRAWGHTHRASCPISQPRALDVAGVPRQIGNGKPNHS